MNERILKLSKQVGLQPYYDAQEGQIERFAELIVRECVELFEVEWGEEKLTGNDVGYVLKKHFGVEE